MRPRSTGGVPGPATSPAVAEHAPAMVPDLETGGFFCFGRQDVRESAGPVIPLPDSVRWLALVRRNIYWMGPVFGRELSEVPAETQFLLMETAEGRHHLILPLLDGDMRFSLVGTPSGVRLSADGTPPSMPTEICGAHVSEGEDPYLLLDRAIGKIGRRLGTFLPRDQKPGPAFADHFGWCTWNAFYDKVDAAKIRSGFESWKSKNLLPSLLIVDDGWQDRVGDYLQDFRPSTAAFPWGLSAVIRHLKTDFGLKMFGIWHAFQGYWGGVHPDSPLARRYRTVANRGKIRPWEGTEDVEKDLFLVHPEEAARFFDEFYGLLRAEGIDFVKVDGQSATEIFTHGVLGRVRVMRAFQDAFQAAGVREFGSEILHCMAHGNDVIWHCKSTNAMRSSDDYKPSGSDACQQQHITDNAYNGIFIGSVALPDWDMFQSNHAHSSYHAAARALSGGPIYVSDEPGEQNVALLEKLVWFDRGTAKTLRCPGPARVTRDRVLVDCRKEKRLLKIYNRVGPIGLLGIFHTHPEDCAIADTFSPDDVADLEGSQFALWRHRDGKLETASREQRLPVTLGRLGWEIIVITPTQDGAALIGLLDKLNAPAGIHKIRTRGNEMKFETRDGGRVGLYSLRAPRAAERAGRPVPWSWNSRTKLLTLDAPPRVSSEFRLEFA